MNNITYDVSIIICLGVQSKAVPVAVNEERFVAAEKNSAWVLRVHFGTALKGNKVKERIHTFKVRFKRERRASYLPCFSFGLGYDRQSMLGSGDVSLMVFIASMSGSRSLTSLTRHFFHFRGPPGLRLSFDITERNRRFGCIQCHKKEKGTSISL